MRTTILLLCCLTLCYCNQKKHNPAITTGNLPVQSFSIDPLKDTVLTTKSNVKISILKGSFPDSGAVNLEVKEAINISDMVLAGLTTTSNENLLQSGGMIQIRGKQNGIEPRILKPIEISVPTTNYDSRMLRFSGEKNMDSTINWTKPESLLNRKEKSIVEEGKNLFQANCASCHGIAKTIAGPPLAFVTNRRCMDWLKAVIRNPAAMVQTDDCLKQQKRQFSGAVMPSFPLLTDSALENIYAYLTSASDSLLPGSKKPEDYDPCDNLVIKDTVGYQLETKKENIRTGKINRSGTDPLPPNNPAKADTTGKNNSSLYYKSLPDTYYTFTIDSFGWYNIDAFLKTDEEVKEGELLVSVNGNKSDDVDVYLVVPSKKILVRGEKNKAGKYFFFYKADSYILLPQDRDAFILAFENYTENPRMGKLSFKTSRQLNLEVPLNVITDIINEVKALNLDNFQLDMEKISVEKKYLINERIYKFVCPERPSADTTYYNEATSGDAFYFDGSK